MDVGNVYTCSNFQTFLSTSVSSMSFVIVIMMMKKKTTMALALPYP
jgi:hypothetical protein